MKQSDVIYIYTNLLYDTLYKVTNYTGYSDFVEFSKMLLAHERVKKIYVLDLDSLIEFKVDTIDNFSYEDVRALISKESCSIEEFENILLSQEFKQRTLYDVIKNSYY